MRQVGEKNNETILNIYIELTSSQALRKALCAFMEKKRKKSVFLFFPPFLF